MKPLKKPSTWITSSVERAGDERTGASGETGRRRASRVLPVLVALLIVVGACGRPDDTKQTEETDEPGPSGATSTTEPAAEAGAFGDLDPVCGPAPEGETLEATDVGVTADSIQIGTLSDPGFQGRPGVNQELFDSAEAFSKWCNELGGIYGREIDLQERDARMTEYQARIIEACDAGDFLLVGGGGIFDDQGQKERLACGLPQIPAFVTNPPAVESDLTIQPMPNDIDYYGVGAMHWLEEQFPDAVGKIGALTGGVAVTVVAMDRAIEAMEALGWDVVYYEKYNSFGEASWRGYAEGLKAAGVRGLAWVGEPVSFAALLKAMDEIDYHPDFVRVDSNIYDQLLIAEAGEAAEGVLIQTPNFPFLDPEVAKQNPATAQYLDIIDTYDPGGKVANLGVSGFSAWLLFAKAAGECGAELTRDCVWEQARGITEWTAGGLHALQNPGGGVGSSCFVMLQVKDGKFEMVDIGANQGVFHCDPEDVIESKADYGEGTKCENPAYADDPKPSNCAST